MRWMGMALLAVAAQAQTLDLSSLDKLDAKAKEATNITMDSEKLRMASGLLSSDADDQKVKRLLKGLKAIQVRTFEFANTGAFSQSDLEPIRRQLQGGKWSRIVDTREDGESTQIYMFGDGKTESGLAVIAAEGKELTVVNIIGTGDLNALAALSALPNIQSKFGSGTPAAPPKPPAPPRKDE